MNLKKKVGMKKSGCHLGPNHLRHQVKNCILAMPKSKKSLRCKSTVLSCCKPKKTTIEN